MAGETRAMKNLTNYIGLGFLLFASSCAGPDQATGRSVYAGTYVRTHGDAASEFELVVKEGHEGTEISFFASRTDGSGAAPEGTGRGHVESDGVLRFSFEDSFANKGIGSLRKQQDTFLLTLNPQTVEDPRAAQFYGDMQLRRR